MLTTESKETNKYLMNVCKKMTINKAQNLL